MLTVIIETDITRTTIHHQLLLPFHNQAEQEVLREKQSPCRCLEVGQRTTADYATFSCCICFLQLTMLIF
jgi:hypothetical protein